jgi:hypothetical protein
MSGKDLNYFGFILSVCAWRGLRRASKQIMEYGYSIEKRQGEEGKDLTLEAGTLMMNQSMSHFLVFQYFFDSCSSSDHESMIESGRF